MPDRASLTPMLVAAAAIIYIASIIAGLVFPYKDVLNLLAPVRSITMLPDPARAATIFLNNIAVAGLLFLGFTVLLPGAYLLAMNGYIVGSVAYYAAAVSGVPAAKVAALILPHGIIESAAHIYAAALGMQTTILLAQGRAREAAERGLQGLALVVYLLLIAAIVETYITPVIAAAVG